MGRHFEVRAAAMGKTAAKKSALFMRASKEIYMAARSGEPNPDSNLALRAVLEKYKGQGVTKDVVERAIKKAAGGDAEAYLSGRYEAFGPGQSLLIVDSLTDNTNRALTDIKTAITKKGGHLATVNYNFTETGVLVFQSDKNKEEIEENLIMGDVDLREVSLQDGYVEVLVEPTAFGAAKTVLTELDIETFEVAEIKMLPNETVTMEGEDLEKFKQLLDVLDELQDVQAVYHNVDL